MPWQDKKPNQITIKKKVLENNHFFLVYAVVLSFQSNNHQAMNT